MLRGVSFNGLTTAENISYCMRAFATAPEACSVLRFDLLKYSGL